MTQVAKTDPLYTQVRNNTGRTQRFGFLGKHGMLLAANEIVLVPGHLGDRLAFKTSNRSFKALEYALKNEMLIIEALPAPILYDPILEVPRMFEVHNDVLGTADPSWDPDGNSAFVATP
jgi:hypothetical protein